MKKILITLSIITICFLYKSRLIVRAQDTSLPLIGQVAIPGENCGDAENEIKENTKCCYNRPTDPYEVSMGGPFDLVSGFLNGLIKERLTLIDKVQKQVTTPPCINGTPSNPGNPGVDCYCIKPTESPLQQLLPMCNNMTKTEEKQQCIDCLSGNNETKNVGVWTGLGCIFTNTRSFIQNTLLNWGIGLAGLISLMCIIFAAFQLQMSGGNPEKIKKAQQLLTSCITGLILIIFSVFILRMIGVSILKIPGFI